MSKCTNTCVYVVFQTMFHLSFKGCLSVLSFIKAEDKSVLSITLCDVCLCGLLCRWMGGWMDGCGWIEKRIEV